MEYREYLREQAAKRRPLAEKTVDPTINARRLAIASTIMLYRMNRMTLTSAGSTWGTGDSGAQSIAASSSYRQRGLDALEQSIKERKD
jgi:hypothetical protein